VWASVWASVWAPSAVRVNTKLLQSHAQIEGGASVGSHTDAGSRSGRRSFRGYCFLTVEAQWYAARWSIGVIGLIMDGVRPARVADQVIDDLRKRERNGLIELPQRSGLKPGDQVRILQGSFAGQLGLYAGMRAHERVLVLLALLGGQQRVELARDGIEAVGQAVLERMLRSVLDALLPEPLERVRVREQRRRAKVRAALRRPRCRSPTWRCSCA